MREAYEEHNPIVISTATTLNEVSTSSTSSNEHERSTEDVEMGNGNMPQSNMMTEDTSCAVCQAKISINHPFLRCKACDCVHHAPEECEYGPSQVVDESGNYCSHKCATGAQIYEVKIVNETNAYYKILWSNGDLSIKTRKKVEEFAEYFKILKEWRKSNPNPVVNAKVSKSKRKNEVKPMAMSIESVVNDGLVRCKVCAEALDDSNPHTCKSCAAPMHGHLSCPRKELITLDSNDDLHCDKCRPKPIVLD